MNEEIRKQITDAPTTKPDLLVLDDLYWKLAVREMLRGGNIIFLGHSGCGKTLSATSLAKAYNRPFFRFNMGAMQDARSSLIGNTHYSTDKGTFFAGSEFVKAIQTENAVILLDEYTRISPDAENIMITVLDKDQRYLRIDEDPNTPSISVAKGVVFMATANVGVEYTSTRILDRATQDRFGATIELPLLSKEQEMNLATKKYPELNKRYIEAFCEIADYTRKNMNDGDNELSTIISTRSIHEQCELALDGFRYSEVVEAVVVNMFDGSGGVDSERSHIRQKAQDRVNLDSESPFAVDVVDDEPEKDEDIDNLFTDEDVMEW